MKKLLMEQFYTCIEKDLLNLQFDFLSKEDINDYLDVRDESTEFGNEWTEQYNQIISRKDEVENEDLICKICKNIFIKVFQWSGSDDLAAYISDDFELIFMAFDIGYNNSWLNGLLRMYLDERFPNDFDEVEKEGTEECCIEEQLKEYLALKS